MGGFLALKNGSVDLSEIIKRLNDSGAKTIRFSPERVVLAAWTEFPGQGLWSDETAAVAYDINLTNATALWELAGKAGKGTADLGLLIWNLYEQFGIDFIDRLRGAFAFAIWDNKKKGLIVVTDYYGIRPVVYTKSRNGFMAASRIRQLLLLPGVSRDIDPEAIYHYLFFQAICSPVTIYKSIRKLEPGRGLRCSEKEVRSFTYYDIRYHPENQHPESHWIREIPREVEKAVRRCAPESDPERTGCFLSGGTDSSSVVGYFTKVTGRPVKTFSIGFDDPKYNELDYARIAARRFGTKQHNYLVTPEDVTTLIANLPEIYDEPFGNASVVPAYYCALLAKQNNVDVLLAGDGGDEIFGGNERYVTNLIFERYFILPKAVRTLLLEPTLKLLPNKWILGKASRYVKRANMLNPERFFSYNLLSEVSSQHVFQAEFLSRCNSDCFLELVGSYYQKAAPAHDTNRLLYLDMKFTITDNDLRKVTAMGESAGVRVRYPLLDRELVDFSTTIPPQLKVKSGFNRYVFKRAMQGFLPSEIVFKTKHGMGLPIAGWFKENPTLSQLLRDYLFSGKPRILEYVKSSFLEYLHSSFQGDKTSYFGDTLWVYLLLELWLRRE